MRNWINLFEYKMFQVEHWFEDHTIWENPTLGDLTALMGNVDLRGQTDGRNLFVWDAANLIHQHGVEAVTKAMRWEGETVEDPRFEKLNGFARPKPDTSLSMYFYNPDKKSKAMYADDWVNEKSAKTMHFLLAPGVAVALPTEGLAKLMTISAVRRVFRNATPIDQTGDATK